MFQKYLTGLFCLLISSQLFAKTTISLNIKNPIADKVNIAYYMDGKTYLLTGNTELPGVEVDDKGNQVVRLNRSGKGLFIHEDMKPGIYLLVYPPKNQYMDFLFEGMDMELNVDGQTLLDHPRNSAANQLLAKSGDYQKRINELKKKYSDEHPQVKQLQKEFEKFQIEQMSNNPTNMYSQVLKASRYPEPPEGLNKSERINYFFDNYFEHLDFRYDWLLRSPILKQKLDFFFKNFVPKGPDSIIASIDVIASKMEVNKEIYQYFVVDQLNKYAKSTIIGQDKIYHHIVTKYYLMGKAPWADKDSIQKMKQSAMRMEGTFLGDIATDFTADNITGETVNLHNINSEYTLLIFTKPECDYCDKQLSEININFPKLTSDINIFNVVLGTNKNNIKSLSTGPQRESVTMLFPTPKEDLRIRQDYNIQSFPLVYLLDRNKKIILKKASVTDTLGYHRSLRRQNPN